jgi:hypothetical protein
VILFIDTPTDLTNIGIIVYIFIIVATWRNSLVFEQAVKFSMDFKQVLTIKVAGTLLKWKILPT